MVKKWRQKFSQLFGYPRPGQVYILPTRLGIYFFLGTFLGILFALSYANPLGIFFILLLFTSFLLTAVMTHRQIMQESHENLKINFRFPEFSERQKSDDGLLLIDIQLEGGRSSSSVPFGVYRPGLIKIVTLRPFHLFRAWKYFSSPVGQLIITPRPMNLTELDRGSPDLDQEISIDANNVMTTGDEPGSLQQANHFSDGKIHWKKVAQGRGPVLIKPGEEWRSPNLIMVDKINLPDLRSRLRQALFTLEDDDLHWGGIKMADGRVFNKGAGLELVLASLVGEKQEDINDS